MYTYIYAPKNAQNEAVFTQALSEFPEIYEQNRYKETRIKTPEDVVDTINFVFQYYGAEYLQIKAITDLIPGGLMSQIDSPQTFTDPKEIKKIFW